jgi:hypothetical protein
LEWAIVAARPGSHGQINASKMPINARISVSFRNWPPVYFTAGAGAGVALHSTIDHEFAGDQGRQAVQDAR